MPHAAMEDAYRHSDTEGGRDPSSTTESIQARARVRGSQVCVEDASVVVQPTEETADRDLLAGLLASSQGSAYASALLQHFPSIGHVISAEASQLRAFGLSRRDIAVLRLVHEIACRMARAEVRSRPILGNWQALIAYLQTAMAYQQIEQFRILFLDRKNTLIADEVQQRGTVNHTPVYPREVMKRTLMLNASALIVVHNHPSGDPKPSREDIETTRQLKAAADALEIELHDHVVIGHGKHASFKSLGLL
ncbi:MAG: DNA repair protein RadC [Reyranella sp.]|nr:DNA repair protein RadC [Reyranella sp.]MBL6653185.1 DNA repair protein RadC [Reyranella sp.]